MNIIKNCYQYLTKPRKYETSSKIKQEFDNFLKWYEAKTYNDPSLKLKYWTEDFVDQYFKEKDFALYGNIRKIYNVNERNYTYELCVTIVAAVGGLILATIIYLIF